MTAQHFPGNHAYANADLLMELHRLCTESERYGETTRRTRGLSRTDMHAIAALGQPDQTGQEVTISDLAAHLVLSLPATTAVVDRLVAHGLVERRRSTQDRRRVNLVPTHEARVMGRDMFQPLAQHLQKALESFTDEERRLLLRLLPPLSEAIMDAHEEVRPSDPRRTTQEPIRSHDAARDGFGVE